MYKRKNVLITGSSDGIGCATAKRLIEVGYSVFVTGRNEEKLKRLKKLSGAAGWLACDLTCGENYKKLYDAAKTTMGSVDILVNNAAEYVYAAIEDTKPEDIERLITLNFKIPYLLTGLYVKDAKKTNWGRIVNIGSISGSAGEANASLYSATKSAFAGMTKSLALELAQNEITVNTINPGWVQTSMSDTALEDGGLSESQCTEMIPQRRFIEPDEVAHLVSYFISDGAKGVTGQSVNICAGLSLG